MLVDANILLYAVDEDSAYHTTAKEWLEGVFSGPRRVGLPWQSLSAFIRIVTNPRAVPDPMDPADAWEMVEAWLDTPNAWIPEPGHGYRQILGQLVRSLRPSGNLMTDAALAALAIEHGLAVASADSDFARFPQLTWINPVAPQTPPM